MITIYNRIITFSFYTLFFLVPLVFTSQTSELFELNKMWLTWALTIIIVTAWISKMILQKQVKIQRTPLDIPIALFLLSQFLSTIISLDTHISVWGYYSRFNGGLLSLVSYVLLYYAFVSNFTKKQVIQSLWVSLASGIIVALWGLPAHYGYDPTCLLFRGSLDVNCWTNAFQPKVRIFSTLGQPNWLAAYVSVFLLLVAGLFIQTLQKQKKRFSLTKKSFWYPFSLVLLLVLFFLDLIFTDSQEGFLGFFAGLVVFLLLYFFSKKTTNTKTRIGITLLILLFPILSFFAGNPIPQLRIFTLSGISQKLHPHTVAAPSATPADSGTALEINITSSSQIRKIVWKGAIDAWKANPIIGTGVETFAFAYYKFRPAAHNLTSEWDYLYNKAHNEYLNYLTTTGLFGFLSYLLMIVLFFVSILPSLLRKDRENNVVVMGLIAAYVSILVSNFFGFSVVIINLFLFLFPGFSYLLLETLDTNKVYLFGSGTTEVKKGQQNGTSLFGGTAITILSLYALYLIFLLYNFWLADVSYALGSNLDHVARNQAVYLQDANTKLHNAIALRGDEPVFKDELANNDSLLAVAYAENKDTTDAQTVAKEAITMSDTVVTQSPNNVVFWKDRVQVYDTLAELNPQFLSVALASIQKASQLAPTDAKIWYSLGVLYGQSGDSDQAIKTLQHTIELKSNYRDAYYALGIMYHYAAVDKNDKVIKPDMQQKAIQTFQNALVKFPGDADMEKSLKSWGA